jgi:hypothetical protein
MTQFVKCRILATVLFVILASSVNAQYVKIDSTSNWKKAFKSGLNISQASFSSNWKAGGVNSFGFNALLNYKANYKKNKTSWDNEIDLLYGMVNNQGQGYRKTLDRIYFETKLGHDLNPKWSFTTSLSLLSQFAKGYKYTKDANGVEVATLISDSFAPTFITSAWGFEYHPVEYFKVRFSPFSPRATILPNNNGRFSAVDPSKPYGVLVGEDTRMEWLAFQLFAEFNKDIAENVNLKWRYIMFANYETIEPKTIDHRLDLNLTAKVNKFMNVSLGGILIYDYDQDPGVQLSQAFTLGILYTFQNYKDKE